MKESFMSFCRSTIWVYNSYLKYKNGNLSLAMFEHELMLLAKSAETILRELTV